MAPRRARSPAYICKNLGDCQVYVREDHYRDKPSVHAAFNSANITNIPGDADDYLVTTYNLKGIAAVSAIQKRERLPGTTSPYLLVWWYETKKTLRQIKCEELDPASQAILRTTPSNMLAGKYKLVGSQAQYRLVRDKF